MLLQLRLASFQATPSTNPIGRGWKRWLGRLFHSPDPIAYTQEQSSVASSTASLVFPIELLRGALWALFAVSAILALPFGWKKTAVTIGLLMAVPVVLSQFLSTTMTIGLQIAHTAEILGENMVFGFLLVRVLHVHSRLPTDGQPESNAP